MVLSRAAAGQEGAPPTTYSAVLLVNVKGCGYPPAVDCRSVRLCTGRLVVQPLALALAKPFALQGLGAAVWGGRRYIPLSLLPGKPQYSDHPAGPGGGAALARAGHHRPTGRLRPGRHRPLPAAHALPGRVSGPLPRPPPRPAHRPPAAPPYQPTPPIHTAQNRVNSPG